MAVDKSSWNSKIKVPQSTIDAIKKQGMAGALKSVGGAAKAASQDSTAAQYAEGVRRLYGDRRYQAAMYKPTQGPKLPTSSTNGSTPAAASNNTDYMASGISQSAYQKAYGVMATPGGTRSAKQPGEGQAYKPTASGVSQDKLQKAYNMPSTKAQPKKSKKPYVAKPTTAFGVSSAVLQKKTGR